MLYFRLEFTVFDIVDVVLNVVSSVIGGKKFSFLVFGYIGEEIEG